MHTYRNVYSKKVISICDAVPELFTLEKYSKLSLICTRIVPFHEYGFIYITSTVHKKRMMSIRVITGVHST